MKQCQGFSSLKFTFVRLDYHHRTNFFPQNFINETSYRVTFCTVFIVNDFYLSFFAHFSLHLLIKIFIDIFRSESNAAFVCLRYPLFTLRNVDSCPERDTFNHNESVMPNFFYKLVCSALNLRFLLQMAHLAWWYYLSKFLEFTDTVSIAFTSALKFNSLTRGLL